jgi:hypothetical protein
VLFDPAVLQLLLASQATIVGLLWHASNNAGAGSSQAAAAAAVHPYHEELLTAMGVPAAQRQQRGVWQPLLTERDTTRAVGDTLMVTRFLSRRLLLLQQQGHEIGSSSSSSSDACGTSLHTEQQQQQQQQQQQIPDVLLPLLPLWSQPQVELLLLVDEFQVRCASKPELHAAAAEVSAEEQAAACLGSHSAGVMPAIAAAGAATHSPAQQAAVSAEMQARAAISGSGSSSSSAAVAPAMHMPDDILSL